MSNDTAEETITSLEVVLILLMGSMDAAARVAHTVLSIGSNSHRAAWQNPNWINEIKLKAPKLGELFEPGRDERHAITILKSLRNSIHGTAMKPIIVKNRHPQDEFLIGLVDVDETQLEEAFSSLGGMHNWGVEGLSDGELLFDPGTLLEELLPRIISVLNEIMENVPLELLDHAELQPSESLPPVVSRKHPFHEHYRRNIRWQLGL
jgi:hypothetical protein